jgi:outer membrane protein TolC
MKRISIPLILLILASTPLMSQRILTLKECYDSVAVNAPAALEKGLISDISSLKSKNIGANYLPGIDLNVSYLYNSDVVDLSNMLGALSSMIPAGALPEIPHDQYRATIDVNQLIWDGGVTRNARQTEQIALELNLQQNEADIYKLRDQVNNYYFTILLNDKQTEITKVLLSEIDSRISSAQSAVNNGVLLKINLDVLTAEKIKAEQSLTDLILRRKALLSVLSSLTGCGDLNNAILALPQPVMAYDTNIVNPDMKLFDLRNRQLEAGKELLRSQRMPRAFGFATIGYGNPPGGNMLSDKADSYYSLGVGLKWNIFDWNKNSNERKVLTLQQRVTEARRSATDEGLQRVLKIKRSEIELLLQAEITDTKLIEIRTGITVSAASQLENGTITATEYLTELNAEKQARITAEMHRINLARTRVEYLIITGKEIE